MPRAIHDSRRHVRALGTARHSIQQRAVQPRHDGVVCIVPICVLAALEHGLCNVLDTRLVGVQQILVGAAPPLIRLAAEDAAIQERRGLAVDGRLLHNAERVGELQCRFELRTGKDVSYLSILIFENEFCFVREFQSTHAH